MTQEETTPLPFYIATAGHKFVPGDVFPNISANPVEGLTFDEVGAASHWVALHPDGSRKVVENTPLTIYSSAHHQAQALLDDNPGSDVHYIRHPGRSSIYYGNPKPTVYIDYDWSLVTEPVNQIPFLQEWKAFVARAAHEFDWTMGAHSLEDLSENEMWTVRHQMYGLITAPWIIMHLLEITDPQAELAGNLLWKSYQTSAEEVLVGLCHECEDLSTYARRFAHQANLELFRGALVQGKIFASDRDVTPWGLSDDTVTEVVVSVGQTPTAEKIAQFHRQNRAEFLNALKFYDTDVGAAERPHSHA